VEIITGLPHHERIVSALCEYDLVGFQTDTDATNFARYVESECHYPGDRTRGYDTGERIMRIGSFAVGVEAESFAKMARRAIKSSFVSGVLSSLSGRAMIIGVDRLDYSKGIGNRIVAFECFLERHPDWRNNVTYLQITPKSRSAIPEYNDMERDVSAVVGRVNGKYGEASWTPVRYVNRAHTRTALAGLYRGWSILTIPKASRPPSTAPCRCRSRSGALARKRCSASCARTIFSTGPTVSCRR
jgi:trehalose 6-phosphate synthase